VTFDWRKFGLFPKALKHPAKRATGQSLIDNQQQL